MSEEILINITPTESRVATVENGMLQQVWLDRVSLDSYLGNVYKGTVCRVLPGMQAAFVDVGLERTAFLHASDIYRSVTGQENPGAPEGENPQSGQDGARIPPINELLVQGSEIVVQVIKDPLGSKGARLTTNLSIPSRFLVLLPGSTTVGVSTRIKDEEEKERLKDLILNLRKEEEEFGYIVRTNAEGVDSFVLAADMTYLRKVWKSIDESIGRAGPGDCIYEDLSTPVKALRDLMHVDVERVRIDSIEVYERVSRFVQQFIPDWTDRIELYEAERPIFDLYGIEDEINQALTRHARLKSGGYLVIDQTEAMTTIDVNTGAFVGHRTQEETIYKTNLEAAQAIARQLRLRNLGGIIVIDFIDMTEEEHRNQVLNTLEKALEKDHARTRICEISPLGLVEMTRKRSSESLGHMLCEPCPLCEGRGRIKSVETVCLEVFREILRSGRQFEASELLVMASPGVVDMIMDEQSNTVLELEELFGKPIRFKREEQYTQEQFDVVLL